LFAAGNQATQNKQVQGAQVRSAMHEQVERRQHCLPQAIRIGCKQLQGTTKARFIRWFTTQRGTQFSLEPVDRLRPKQVVQFGRNAHEIYL
jgi:hypothetical protein